MLKKYGKVFIRIMFVTYQYNSIYGTKSVYAFGKKVFQWY